MMKKCFFTLVLLLTVMVVHAQEKKFSHEKFNEALEQHIQKKAELTQEEADKVFPLLREMHKKQRAIYRRVHEMAKNKPADEAGCKAMVEEYDKMNIELKQIEKNYHAKMMQEVPASKVYEIIKAEYRFHRHWMKGAQKPMPKQPMDKRR